MTCKEQADTRRFGQACARQVAWHDEDRRAWRERRRGR
jgi:hypothetical protein